MRHYVVEQIFETEDHQPIETVSEESSFVIAIIVTNGSFPTDEQIIDAIDESNVEIVDRYIDEVDKEFVTIEYSWFDFDEPTIDYVNVYPIDKVIK